MKVLITGSTGLIGSAFVRAWEEDGHEVVRLVRGEGDGQRTLPWDPQRGVLASNAFADVEGVIHLAGASIGEGRWTAARKQAIRDSRVDSTALLAKTMAALDCPPKVWVCASAVGFYGDRGDEELTEDAAPGDGFLSEVCQAWESACTPAVERGIRVVNARFGVVLSPAGGALKQMLPPFRIGIGGRLGSGRQYMSWVVLEDAVRALRHALEHPNVRGPINVTSPHPVTNRDFTKALGSALSRPTVAPVPATALRLLFGEMGDALLLTSTRVLPRKLIDSGFSFLAPEIGDALRGLLRTA